ncbi:cholecystokinin receptor type A-like [Gigantopelta aegis]|uniref:cholecystokinin receptor type A-like n=1 Tax=Gigantopelta aegis TaxID=1735272 RepID=UPI001B88B286|nr:cholecystokinin receptor type A-like [Gigantopelta aegis]
MATRYNVNCENTTLDIMAAALCNVTSLVTGDVDVYFASNPTTSSFQATNSYSNFSKRGSPSRGLGMDIQIPLYAVIFLLSLVGNMLVIVTIIQNKKMRTVTNVFLLNLSLSDLLLAVFCMPFTLIPLLLKNFIFGETMCIMIRYFQAVSVAVSCFTLVAISLERYFAICRPLHSRSWQTLSHAYKALAVCWFFGLFIAIPIAVYHRLTSRPRLAISMCREQWDNEAWEKAYTMILNIILLVLPVIIMSLAYGMISYTLWAGMKLDQQSEKEKQQNNGCYSEYDSSIAQDTGCKGPFVTDSDFSHNTSSSSSRPFRRFELHRAMRQSNSEKSRASKRRVIKMLFAIVLEFFICWTPTYIITTWIVFDNDSARRHISPMAKSFVHLLSYVSSCCNPITYCFMNRNFRQGFVSAFRCCRRRYVYARRNEMSFSGNTASTRTVVASQVTSYDKIHESDEISEKSF